MSEPAVRTDGAGDIVDRAAELLAAAIVVETKSTYHRGATVAAMAFAEGVLRMVFALPVPRRAVDELNRPAPSPPEGDPPVSAPTGAPEEAKRSSTTPQVVRPTRNSLHTVVVKQRLAGSELDWKELGRVVRARRNHLGLRVLDVTRAGGPSTETQKVVEYARRTVYNLRTLAKIELALQWPPGTAVSILTGTAVDLPGLIRNVRGENDEP